MDLDEATAWLRRSTEAESRPVLGEDDLADCLLLARVADTDGNEPSSEDWTPTFSAGGLYAAAKEGWERKAGKAAALYTFTSEGQRFDRAQIHAHCVAMAKRYGRKVHTSTRTNQTPDDLVETS